MKDHVTFITVLNFLIEHKHFYQDLKKNCNLPINCLKLVKKLFKTHCVVCIEKNNLTRNGVCRVSTIHFFLSYE